MSLTRAYALASTRRLVGHQRVDLFDWEQVAVEAMVLLFTKADQVVNLRAWLRGTVENLVRREVFKRPPFTELVSDETPAPQTATDTADEELSRDEERALHARDQLLDALRSLPPSLRIVGQMSYLERQSTREIAASLKISPEAVRKRLERLRGALRKHFAESAR